MGAASSIYALTDTPLATAPAHKLVKLIVRHLGMVGHELLQLLMRPRIVALGNFQQCLSVDFHRSGLKCVSLDRA